GRSARTYRTTRSGTLPCSGAACTPGPVPPFRSRRLRSACVLTGATCAGRAAGPPCPLGRGPRARQVRRGLPAGSAGCGGPAPLLVRTCVWREKAQASLTPNLIEAAYGFYLRKYDEYTNLSKALAINRVQTGL